MDKKMIFTSSCVEIAEHKDYLELENLVCYYNYPNANGRQLNYGKTKEERAASLERAKTLLLMPVYAKCAVNRKGEPTFKGHEVTRNSKGEVQFGTVPIGVHHKVRIKKASVVAADGTPQVLPCLFATQKIWKRNKNAVAAIRRLFAEGKLFNSWELDVEQYQYQNGLKHLEEYSFLGNTFLGYEYASPAYGTGGGAKVLSVASQEDLPDVELSETELMLAEALYQDGLEQTIENEKEEVSEAMSAENFEVTIEEPIVEAEVSTETVANEDEAQMEAEAEIEAVAEEESEEQEPAVSETTPEEEPAAVEEAEEMAEPAVAEEAEEESGEPEVSMLTSHDLHRRLEKVLNPANTAHYRYIAHLFPADNMAWVRQYGPDMNDLDFTEIVYQVNGDEVEVMSETPITLVASPREFSTLLSQKDEQISGLEAQVNELSEIKTKYDAMISAQQEEAHRAEVAELRTYVEKSGYFTNEELEGPELSAMIEELKSTEIKVMIAERAIASKAVEAPAAVEVSTTAPKMELDYDTESIEKKRSRMWSAFIGK